MGQFHQCFCANTPVVSILHDIVLPTKFHFTFTCYSVCPNSISSTFDARFFRTNVILAFFLTTYVHKKAAKMTFVQKKRVKTVDEIDGWTQFHQHLRSFFVQKFIQSQNVTRKWFLYKKVRKKKLDEIDSS